MATGWRGRDGLTRRDRPGTLVRAASDAESRAGHGRLRKRLFQPTTSAERLRYGPAAPDLDAVRLARESP